MLSQSQRKLTAKELAAKLGCSVSTVYRLKLAGRLEYAQPGGKGHMVRFDEDCLNLKSTQVELKLDHLIVQLFSNHYLKYLY